MCIAHTLENCIKVLTGKINFSPSKVHYMPRVVDFILNIVPLSKLKDLVIVFLFGLELQLQKSVTEDIQVLCHTFCVCSSVQIVQELLGALTDIRCIPLDTWIITRMPWQSPKLPSVHFLAQHWSQKHSSTPNCIPLKALPWWRVFFLPKDKSVLK